MKTECVICYEEKNENELNCCTTPCKGRFCEPCSSSMMKNVCPYCRALLFDKKKFIEKTFIREKLTIHPLCDIEEIPTLIKMKSLNFCGNKNIKKIEDQPNLELLYCLGTGIEQLPKCPNLKTLVTDRCELHQGLNKTKFLCIACEREKGRKINSIKIPI